MFSFLEKFPDKRYLCTSKMKYIIIQGDGMADRSVSALDGKTPIQSADTPWFDFLAKNGRSGLLKTIPEGFPPGSEVGNLSILGYDVKKSFEGRGPLEAASIGYEMTPDDLALRCNIIALDNNNKIINHHGDNLTTEEGKELIEFLNGKLGSERIHFYPGIQYRHLLIIKNGKKGLKLFPPHDNVGKNASELLRESLEEADSKPQEETMKLINDLIKKSWEMLKDHPINIERIKNGKNPANSIWPWSEGHRPEMTPLVESFPHIKGGVMITAVDLLRGIGHYAGLKNVEVKGATGLADTNYEGKMQAAVDALAENDFVFLHVEATDEASHDRDLNLKLRTIEFLDKRIVGPLIEATKDWEVPVRIALLPDHPTSVETGKHLDDPVPFVIYQKGTASDNVMHFNEVEAKDGAFGLVQPTEFISLFLTK